MSVNDSLVNWGKAHELADASSAKLAIQGLNGPRPDDFARVGSYNEGLEQIADLMADSALWLDAEYSGGKPHSGFGGSEPRVRNLGGGDRTAVSGAVIFGGKAVLPGFGSGDGNALTATVTGGSVTAWTVVLRLSGPWQSTTATIQRIINFGIASVDISVQSGNFYNNGGVGLPAIPVGMLDGETYWLKIEQDGVGNRTYSYAADQATEPSAWTVIGSVGSSGQFGTGTLTVGNYYTLALDRTWEGDIYFLSVTDASGTFFEMDLTDVPNWAGSFTAATGQTVTLNTTAANYGAPSALDAKYGSVLGAYVYDGAAVLPGIAGNYLSTPDAAEFDITGDIEVVVRYMNPDWSLSPQSTLFAKCSTSSTREWYLEMNTAGLLLFTVSSTGSNTITATSAAPGLTDGVTYWIKATRTATSGDVNFYIAADQPTEPTVWTQVGSSVPTSAGISIFNGTSSVDIGSRLAGTQNNIGSCYRAILRNGIDGTTVLDVDLGDVADYATSFTATTGQTVTVNSTTSDTNDPLLLTHTGENYVYLPGTAGNKLVATTALGGLFGQSTSIEIEYDGVDSTRPAGSSYLISNLTSALGGGGYGLLIATSGALTLNTHDGTLFQTATSTAVLPASGVTKVKASLGSSVVRFYYSTGGAWVQLGSDVAFAFTSGPGGYTTVQISSNNDTAQWYETRNLRRVVVRDAADGNDVFDFNAATDITDAGATSITTTSGHTLTVGRATTGRKTALVTRPVWLFGTDDYLEVADNALLDFGAGEELTLLAVVRQWNTFGTSAVAGKTPTSISTGGAYRIINAAGPTYRGDMGTGASVNTIISSATITQGPLRSVFLLRKSATGELVVNNTVVSSADATTGQSIANAQPFRVGAYTDSSSYNDQEVAAVAVFRRALTTDEIAAINNYYGTV